MATSPSRLFASDHVTKENASNNVYANHSIGLIPSLSI